MKKVIGITAGAVLLSVGLVFSGGSSTEALDLQPGAFSTKNPTVSDLQPGDFSDSDLVAVDLQPGAF
jgi:hypothetical protein